MQIKFEITINALIILEIFYKTTQKSEIVKF